MNKPLSTEDVLRDLAAANENGNAPLHYEKLTERQKSAIRTATWDTWLAIWETIEYGKFTIQLLGTTVERFISIMEQLPEPVEN